MSVTRTRRSDSSVAEILPLAANFPAYRVAHEVE
jgi:hypothetical protein